MSDPNSVTVRRDASGNFYCDPDTVKATGRNATLVFTVAVDGYSFRHAQPLVVDGPTSQFPLPPDRKGDKVVTLHDANSQSGTFKYSVHLQRDGSSDVVDIDPYIQNE